MPPEIHPDIRSFYEKKGFTIEYKERSKTYIGYKPDAKMLIWFYNYLYERTIASVKSEPINYFFNNEFVSEAKMLRLIKLQAFL